MPNGLADKGHAPVLPLQKKTEPFQRLTSEVPVLHVFEVDPEALQSGFGLSFLFGSGANFRIIAHKYSEKSSRP